MSKDENKIIGEIRDYLYREGISKINALKISEDIKIPLEEILSVAPTPEQLIARIFNYELLELEAVFEEHDLKNQNAIDSLIITGQELYKKFHDLNPSVSYHLKNIFPELFEQHLNNKINYLTTKIINNLEKGQAQGIYKKGIDADKILQKFIDRIAKIHDDEILSSGNLTFDIVTNNIIENFVKDITLEDDWEYFQNRKHLIEALDFNR